MERLIEREKSVILVDAKTYKLIPTHLGSSFFLTAYFALKCALYRSNCLAAGFCRS